MSFVTWPDILRAATPALRPPRDIPVSDTAAAYRVLRNPGGGYSGAWSNSFAPYLTEIMDATQRRDLDMVVAVGPTQFGKTEILLNRILHEAAEGGADSLILQPTQALALDFSERRLDKMFHATPQLANLIGSDRGDDKRLSKLFRNGARATIVWPVSAQLASRPVPLVMIDERDSMSDDIDGEGDPVELAKQRTVTFGRHAMVVVMSTCKRADGGGIMARYHQGDRRLWHWRCPDCSEHFTPGFDRQRRPTLAHLRVRPDATEDQARAEACVVCPHCGSLIDERHKLAMNAAGVWLPEGATIDRDGNIGGTPLRSRTASYWLSGLATRTASRGWGELAAEYVRALRTLENRQDEQPLKNFWNLSFGGPYRSVLAGAEQLEPEALRERAEDLQLGIVPAWAGFVTAAIDVQGNRFDCQAMAWGPDNRGQIIDAWQIFKTRDADGTERLLEPARRAEDWHLLTSEVLNRVWRGVDGQEFKAVTVGIDTGGADGTTGQAYDWWHGLRRDDPSATRRVMLLKGESRRDAPLLSLRRIETDKQGRRLKRGIALTLVNTEALKDQVDIRLRMTKPGPGWLHLSKHLPERFWEEATAEARGPKGWEKRRPRNESFDLLVYNLAVWHRRGGPRVDWNHPPDWATPRAGALLGRLPSPPAAERAPAPAVAPRTPPAPPSPRSRYWKPVRGPMRMGARF